MPIRQMGLLESILNGDEIPGRNALSGDVTMVSTAARLRRR